LEIQIELIVALGVIGAVVALVWGAVALAKRSDRKTQQAWQDFALRNGLAYEPQTDREKRARVRGKLRGRSFTMWEESVRTSSESNAVRTRIYLKVRGMPDGLGIYPRPAGALGETVLGGVFDIAKRLGARIPPEVETGDTAFDEKWVTHGFDADMTRAWIGTGDRKQTLLELNDEAEVKTFEEGLRWEDFTPSTVEAIEAVALTLEGYAERLEHPEMIETIDQAKTGWMAHRSPP
jgi:hypothetical protein